MIIEDEEKDKEKEDNETVDLDPIIIKGDINRDKKKNK